MSRRTGLLLVTALLAIVGLVPWPIPATPFVAALNGQIQPDAGVSVIAARTARFTLLPVPGVTVRRVVAQKTDGTVLATVPHLKMRMRVLPLMAGQLHIHDLIAYTPDVSIDAQARGSWAAVLSSTGTGNSRSALTVVNGAARIGDMRETVVDLNGTAEWQGDGSTINAWGHGLWRGEKVQLQASGLALMPARHAPSASTPSARLSVRTPFATLQASGTISDGQAEGSVTLAMENAAGLARWTGKTVPLAGMLDRFTVSGQGAYTARGLSLADATFAFGANTLTGTLTAATTGERPLISGTLATTALDLSGLTGAVDAIQDYTGAWSKGSFDTRSLQTADFDLRISATSVRMLKMTLGEAALSASLKNGRLDLTLGRSAAYGGTLRGRTSITRVHDALTEQRGQLSFEGVDFGKFSDDFFGARLMTGIASGNFQGESTGSSPSAIISSLSGRGSLILKQGELSGINLAETVRRADRDGVQPATLQSGRTRFDSAVFQATIQNGVLDIQDGQIIGGAAQAVIGGKILLPSREYQLTGAVLHPLRARQWPFELNGPWSKPVTRAAPLVPVQRTDDAKHSQLRAHSRS
ncbi:MAG: AsmA family protein [Beijerinckiaceae bacterium]